MFISHVRGEVCMRDIEKDAVATCYCVWFGSTAHTRTTTPPTSKNANTDTHKHARTSMTHTCVYTDPSLRRHNKKKRSKKKQTFTLSKSLGLYYFAFRLRALCAPVYSVSRADLVKTPHPQTRGLLVTATVDFFFFAALPFLRRRTSRTLGPSLYSVHR